MSQIKDDFVLDGELLVWDFKEQIAFDFSLLQKRINRKSPTRSIQKKYPIIFIAYDLLYVTFSLLILGKIHLLILAL